MVYHKRSAKLKTNIIHTVGLQKHVQSCLGTRWAKTSLTGLVTAASQSHSFRWGVLSKFRVHQNCVHHGFQHFSALLIWSMDYYYYTLFLSWKNKTVTWMAALTFSSHLIHHNSKTTLVLFKNFFEIKRNAYQDVLFSTCWGASSLQWRKLSCRRWTYWGSTLMLPVKCLSY